MAKTKRTRNNETVTIRGARLIFRNFSGKKGTYNAEGDRNFCVILPPETADELLEKGWNVKELPAKEDDPDSLPIPYIRVSVNYDGYRPPKITLINSKGKTPITEDDVSLLDWAEISNVDLILNPYHWEVNGKTGIKAYLKTLFVEIYEDELELEYANIEDSAQLAISEEEGEESI